MYDSPIIAKLYAKYKEKLLRAPLKKYFNYFAHKFKLLRAQTKNFRSHLALLALSYQVEDGLVQETA